MDSFNIEKQLFEFKDDVRTKINLLHPFTCKEVFKYSLKDMICEFWFIFRTENEQMKAMYPKNIEIAENYISTYVDDPKSITLSEVYLSFEKICKIFIENPKRYISIRFHDDHQFAYIIKRDDVFQILSATFNTSSNLSKIFKEGSFKDVPDAQDVIFVLATSISYDDIDLSDMVST